MAGTTTDELMPAMVVAPSNRQRLFVRYFTAILVDLVVLNLFVEYSDKVVVSTFTMSLFAAILLQILMRGTIAVEHWVAGFFIGKPGGWMKFWRYFCAWLVLFGSKFVILEAIAWAFSGEVRFEGRFHGLITLILVIVVMLLAEEAFVRFYRWLGKAGDEDRD